MDYRLAKPYHLDERKVKHRMLDLGISGVDIARLIGTSPATITRHIKAQRHNLEVQRAIAKVLKCNPEDLATNGQAKRRKAA